MKVFLCSTDDTAYPLNDRLLPEEPIVKIIAIKTSLFSKDTDLTDFILKHVGKHLKEKTILAVTSKILSIAENRTVPKKSIDKITLIKQECEHYLGNIGYGCHLTIKHNLLVPSAGIDESNSENGDYILYPKNPFTSATKIMTSLKKNIPLKDFGVIITDSHTSPRKVGVTGMALAYSGFLGIKNLVGQRDLFNRPLKITKINIADALAASAVLLMGEGSEQKPLAIINKAPVIFSKNNDYKESHISIEEDLYAPLYEPLIQKKAQKP